MDQATKAGIDQQEQTVDAANLASAMNGEEEENVTAKENYKLDNSHISVENE
ncbi:hypothetical protein ACP26L_12660 [Paenibacillus sp. S-38]|uniref:hypothetical protein n=1 Tax=Paenibacillus sp. S-38 TaxID=3416710 RepID=UPI003CF2554E